MILSAGLYFKIKIMDPRKDSGQLIELVLPLSAYFLPPASAVEVIESEPCECVCVSVCEHSHGQTV